MTFKYYPRYFCIGILTIFNSIVTYFTGLKVTTYIFYIISIVLLSFIFGFRYTLDNNILSKYFIFIKIQEVDVFKIHEVEIVTVKQAGTFYVYIGKNAKENKESGYYLVFENGERIKVNCGYQNENRETLGKYIIKKYGKRSKNIEKYKWTNDRF